MKLASDLEAFLDMLARAGIEHEREQLGIGGCVVFVNGFYFTNGVQALMVPLEKLPEPPPRARARVYQEGVDERIRLMFHFDERGALLKTGVDW